MHVQKLSAFSDGNTGGNPAGVVIADTLPSAADMQRIAAEVGFSETAFAAPLGDGWRVRYFAPEIEIPFCGHATIALGAALALQQGDGVFALTPNQAQITVEGRRDGSTIAAALQSPPPAANRRPPRWSTKCWRCLATRRTTWTRAFHPHWPMAAPTTWCWRCTAAPPWPPCTTTWPLAAA